MILFKVKELIPTFAAGLPSGSAVQICKILQPAPVLLILDGAASYLDFTIAEKANSLGITLLYLQYNTTHKLQPMDKSVFPSFGHFWGTVTQKDNPKPNKTEFL